MHAMEIAAGIVAVFVIGMGVFVWQLSQGPISFGRFTPHVESILSSATANVDIEIEDAVLRWSNTDRAVHFRVVGVDLRDRQGVLIGHVPEIEIDLAVKEILSGNLTPSRVELFGPSAVIVRNIDGSFQLGFAEDTLANSQNNDGPERPERPEQGQLFSWLAAELASQDEGKSALATLKTFTIRDAKIEFYDQHSGTMWVAPQALVSMYRDETGIAWQMSGDVKVGLEEVSISLAGNFNAETKWISTAMQFSNVSLSSFAAKSNYFEDLAGFDFPINGQAQIQINETGELQIAELELSVGEGTVLFRELGDDPVPVNYGAFSATYTGDQQKFDIRRLHFVAGENKGTLKGTAQIAFNTAERLQIQAVRFDLEGEDIAVDVPLLMKHLVSVDEMKVEGFIDFIDRWLRIDTLDLRVDKAKLSLHGDILDAEGSPAVVINGELTNVPIDALDVLWPKGLGPGARYWVTQNLDGGVVTKGVLTVNAAPGAFAERPIAAGVLNLDFRAEGTKVTYIKGLPRIVDASADLYLTGNTFGLRLTSGRVVDVVGEELMVGVGSTLHIGDLSARGSPILIDTSVRGRAQDILTLIDQPPLGYPTRFGVEPAAIGGTASASMSFSIPSQARKASWDNILFNAVARIDDVTLPRLVGNLTIDGGAMDLTIDRDGLVGEGEITIAGVPSTVKWTEKFDINIKSSSTFLLDVNFNALAQTNWGLDTNGALTGDVPVSLSAKGKGAKISEIKLAADLTQSTIAIDAIDFAKQAGDKASAEMLVHFSESGALNLDNFKLSSDSVAVTGTMRLAPDGKLDVASFKRIWIDDFMDVEFLAERGEIGDLQVSVSGDYLNISPFLVDMMADFGGKGSADDAEQESEPSPWSFKGEVADLYLRGGVALQDVAFEVSNDGEKITSLNLTGDFEDQGSVFAALTSGNQGNRHLVVTTSDGGRVVRGITGIDQIIGGELALEMEYDDRPRELAKTDQPLTMAEYLNAYARAKQAAGGQEEIEDVAIRAALENERKSLRSLESESTISGFIKIDDFSVVKAPLLARLLTVGSLRGLSDTLAGDGIRFASLEAPFWVDEKGVIGVSDATASGPALGLTLVGTLDQGTNETDFQGTIVPSYTLNSALGNLPLLGPMLVSREGEGIFAFTYGISGPTDGPTVYVNPLSGLAPGFLRRVFQGRDQQEARRVPIEQLEDPPVTDEEPQVQ